MRHFQNSMRWEKGKSKRATATKSNLFKENMKPVSKKVLSTIIDPSSTASSFAHHTEGVLSQSNEYMDKKTKTKIKIAREIVVDDSYTYKKRCENETRTLYLQLKDFVSKKTLEKALVPVADLRKKYIERSVYEKVVDIIPAAAKEKKTFVRLPTEKLISNAHSASTGVLLELKIDSCHQIPDC